MTSPSKKPRKENSSTEPTIKMHEKALIKCLPELVKDLDWRTVLDYVIQKDVLPQVTIRDITDEKTTSDKIRKLVEHIQRRDQDTYSTFKECLVAAKQKFLKEMLEMEEKLFDVEELADATHQKEMMETGEMKTTCNTTEQNRHVMKLREEKPQPFKPGETTSSANVQAAATGTGSTCSIKSSTPTTSSSVQVLSIASLTPYQNRGRIRARVTYKSDIRTWSNSRGEGRLFNVNLVDESGEIRATGFTDAVEKFYNLLEVNKVFYISRTTLKTANKQYSTVKNDYEMTFNKNTCIVPCEDDSDLPTMPFNIVNINELEKTQPNGLVGGGTNWKFFSQVKSENLGQGDKADFFTSKGTVIFLRKENCMYQACPTETCNKKVIDQGNGMFRCEKCSREFPDFKWRMILSVNLADFSDNQWVTCFHESAETILGKTAAELGHLRESNEAAFNQVFKDALFRSFIVKLRAKVETYNDESRLKTVCTTANPINWQEHGRRLVDDINKMLSDA